MVVKRDKSICMIIVFQFSISTFPGEMVWTIEQGVRNPTYPHTHKALIIVLQCFF